MSSTTPQSGVHEFIDAFRAVRHLDRRFWVPNLVFLLDGAAYFGILNILTLHLGTTVGLGDVWAGRLVALMTGALTLVMAVFGGFIDRVGVRTATTLAIAASLLGRLALVLAPRTSPGGELNAANALSLGIVVGGLLLIAFGAGVLQTAVYSAVKQSTDARTSALGFSLIYALMNAGIVLESLASSLVRQRFGTDGVLWMCVAITALYLVTHLTLFPKGAGKPVIATARDGAPLGRLAWREHPLANPHFLFFIFVLLGVRTLFAHQWLTMPDYVTRAYPHEVGARYEWITGLNPLIIVIGTPLVAAATRRVHVLTMMIIGTSVSALATFLLVPGPHLSALLTYVIIFSLGEALWSSRFLEYVASVAPPERVGVYMGVANIPWFLAKLTTGLYSGAMLAHYVPAQGAQDSSSLWLFYAALALSSPLGLIAARQWLLRGVKASSDAVAVSAASA